MVVSLSRIFEATSKSPKRKSTLCVLLPFAGTAQAQLIDNGDGPVNHPWLEMPCGRKYFSKSFILPIA